MLQFTKDPRTVGIIDGIGMSLGFLVRSWRIWIPIAIGLAVYAGIAAVVGFDVSQGRPVGVPAGARTPIDFTVGVLASVPRQLADVYLTAVALASVRGRTADRSWLKRVLPPALAVQVLLGVATSTLAAVLSVGTGIGSPPWRVFALEIGAVVSLYLEVRLFFWQLAVLDGSGIAGGLRRTWDLSKRSLLRIVRWLLLATVPVLIATIALGNATKTIEPSPVAAALKDLTTAAWLPILAALTTVLYESQRWREDAPTPVAAPAVEASDPLA